MRSATGTSPARPSTCSPRSRRIPANPLLQLDKVVVTPHLGASTREAQVNVAFDVADQIVEYLAGGTPRYAVNAPTVLPEELARLQPYLVLGREDRLARGAARRPQAAPHRLQLLGRARRHRHVDRHRARAARALRAFHRDARQPGQREGGRHVDGRRRRRAPHHAQRRPGGLAARRGRRASRRCASPARSSTTARGSRASTTSASTCSRRARSSSSPTRTVPGVIAAISTLLARNDVNIAGIELGRDRPRGHAVMLMEIDDPVGAELLEEVRETAMLDQLRQVRL